MKQVFLFLLLVGSLLFAEEAGESNVTQDANSTLISDSNVTDESNATVHVNEEGLIEVKDTSGLSEEELQQKADKLEQEESQKVSLEKIVKNIDDNGTVDISNVQKPWEELSPKASEYDWVETKKGEWFKGKIIAMYDDKLEFDSEEMGFHTFKLKKVRQIKSHSKISVNIENLASFEGILRYKEGKLKLIQGDNVYDFDIKDVVSFVPGANHERDLWSVKLSISLDVRAGNVDQYDYTAKGDAKRRTADSVLAFTYLGRISSKNKEPTANNQRLSQRYDIYSTRYIFWTPISSEYYMDKFKNIAAQVTVGVGGGYTVFKEGDDELSFSGGPAVIYTRFESVVDTNNINDYSFALEMRTYYEVEVNQISDYKFEYKITYGDKQVGTFKHHLVSTLENELLSWLDVDFTFVWDYIAHPQIKSDGTRPQSNDYQLLVGLGVEF